MAASRRAAVSRVITRRLRKAGALGLLLPDSITPTVMAGGYKSNVVPGAWASFDCRLLPDTDVDEIVSSLDKKGAPPRGARCKCRTWRPRSGHRQQVAVRHSRACVGAGRTGCDPDVVVVAGITDLRFFRTRGATRGCDRIWLLPMVLTPELLATIHGHDERVSVADFERVVAIMSDVARRACTWPGVPGGTVILTPTTPVCGRRPPVSRRPSPCHLNPATSFTPDH